MSKVSRTDRNEPVRKQRVPVASNRAPLLYKGLDLSNFSYRWVLDNEDRIATFLEAGYDFAPPVSGNIVGEKTVDTTNEKSSRVSRSAKYGGLKLFLMRIPIEFYNEDQAAKQREIDEMEDTMREPGKGRIVGKDVDFGSIKLERKGMGTPEGS